VKLVCAAPESFFSFAEASQVAFASASHFFKKLVWRHRRASSLLTERRRSRRKPRG
jgi:hypothetical protein